MFESLPEAVEEERTPDAREIILHPKGKKHTEVRSFARAASPSAIRLLT